MNMVKMKIHAGGGWEGHVVYTSIHPKNPEINHLSSNYEEVKFFCKKHELELDKDFEQLVRKHLTFHNEHGIIIPPEYIDEHRPITSASEFLKKNFSEYY